MPREHWLYRLGFLRRTGPGELGKVDPVDESGYGGRNWALGPLGSLLSIVYLIAAIGIVTGLVVGLALLARWLL